MKEKMIDALTEEEVFGSDKAVKKFREEMNLSVMQFSTAIGVARNTVYNWEKGKNSPYSYNIKRIEEVFCVEYDRSRCAFVKKQEEQKEEKSPTEQGEKKKLNAFFVATIVFVIATAVYGLAVLIRIFLHFVFLKPDWIDTKIAVISAAVIVTLYAVAMLVFAVIEIIKKKRQKD